MTTTQLTATAMQGQIQQQRNRNLRLTVALAELLIMEDKYRQPEDVAIKDKNEYLTGLNAEMRIELDALKAEIEGKNTARYKKKPTANA